MPPPSPCLKRQYSKKRAAQTLVPSTVNSGYINPFLSSQLGFFFAFRPLLHLPQFTYLIIIFFYSVDISKVHCTDCGVLEKVELIAGRFYFSSSSLPLSRKLHKSWLRIFRLVVEADYLEWSWKLGGGINVTPLISFLYYLSCCVIFFSSSVWTPQRERIERKDCCCTTSRDAILYNTRTSMATLKGILPPPHF